MKKVVCYVSIVIMVMSILSGCSFLDGGKKESGTQKSVVIVNASNANSIEVKSDDLRSVLSDVGKSSGLFSYIVADGAPSVACSNEDLYIDADGISKQNYTRRLNSRVEEVFAKIHDAKPKTEEVDLIEALNCAAKLVSDSDDSTIEMFTSGLSTKGSLDMRGISAVENIDTAKTIKKLNGTLPKLKGTDVYFHLMDTAGKQDQLSETEEKKIISLWEKIITAAGGKFNLKYYLPDNPSAPVSVPKVTPVPVTGSKTAVCVFKVDELPKKLPENFSITIDESAISFKENTAEVKNLSAAKKIIRPLAKKLQNNKIDVLVIGSTSTYGEKTSSIELSKERCCKIRSLLEDAGVKTKIEVKGYGYDPENPFFVNDLDENGDLDESRAVLNRKVTIISLDSKEAKQILS